MRKLIALAIMATVTLGLVGCSGGSSDPGPAPKFGAAAGAPGSAAGAGGGGGATGAADPVKGESAEAK